MSQLTTHILDTTLGRPAAGVAVALLAPAGPADWRELAHGTTNADGRLTNLLPLGQRLAPGVYKLRFATGAYFERTSTPHFYPVVEICFTVADEAHYHVPLLLNPFGYSTYRGS
ncbi:hydroxyisourate hydrolase [Hymenobacter sp. RP-2-7]|uniref:5-hydroxyisourate hydrolase n=1 Tax=Hymenobacter polaris TaxID=2682546 RepID=A0A7Y0AI53_9BACT|nr:hydroxyisourate hydrolase [Hymenobacter polaris]NML67747.1 hydroxyisourate hydrolase [Hymenobacter polaris]